jgi:hypothetical protein
MKIKHLFFLVLALVPAVLASLLLVGCESGTAAPDLTPQQVVVKFYRWYIGYPGNPLVDREYRHNPYLAESFVQEIDEALENLSRGSADPILLARTCRSVSLWARSRLRPSAPRRSFISIGAGIRRPASGGSTCN